MFYFTYVLKSERDGKLYVGSTSDLDKRIQRHHDGQVQATRYRRPLVLLYYEACPSLELAREREKQLKTGYGRSYLKRRLGIEST